MSGLSLTMVVLRLLHILGGIFWVGGTLLLGWFVLPAVRDAGPAGGRFMEILVTRHKLPVAFRIAGPMTVLSGIALMWIDSRGGSFMTTHFGQVLSFGAAVGIVAAVIGVSVGAPTARKIAALGAQMASAGGPPDAAQIAEMQRLQNRVSTALRYGTALLVVAAAAMATARYV